VSRTLTIHTDDLLEDALRARAQTQGKTVPEMAREILSRALLGRPQSRPRHREEPAAGREHQPPPLNRREREHAWRRSNRDLLQGQYAGQWVVLEGEEILAHDKDAVQAVEEAKAKGVVVPYVFFVHPPRPPGVVRMGL
jgi:plasmid stability protein